MDTLKVQLDTIDEHVRFSAAARENPQVTIDYFPPVGSGRGYTSLELLMISFGSCVGTTVLTLLRHRMQKEVAGISIGVAGEVREAHPKALRCMQATLRIRADDVSEADIWQALKVAEDSICPVWAMLKGNVEIGFTVEIAKLQ